MRRSMLLILPTVLLATFAALASVPVSAEERASGDGAPQATERPDAPRLVERVGAGSVERAGEDWQSVREEAGIRVTRRVGPGEGPPLRAIVEIEASLFEVLAVLDDATRRTEWMPRCIEARRVGEAVRDRSFSYARTEAPWPVSDRDAVVAADLRIARDRRSLRIDLTGVERPEVPPVDGVVRMPRLEGSYQLDALGPTRTRIEYRIDVDLGGSVPGFVLRFVRDQMPFDTLEGLRAQIAKTRGDYRAEIEALEASLPPVD